jgi:transcriptional regulator with XRE-family HTH domain
MDGNGTGERIRQLRREKGMTQSALARAVGVTDKAVSKWERGRGLPDVSLLGALALALGADMEALLRGGPGAEEGDGGNMKKARYFVCPACGSITFTTGEASVSCCGRRLEPLTPVKAPEEKKLRVETVEDEWFVSGDRPMTREDYVSFLAFADGDRVQLVRQYPEWNLQTRFPNRGHGMLLWYSAADGLLYQLI